MLKHLIRTLSFFDWYGWKGLYSLFFPVSWKQDCKMKNRGIDYILFDKNKGYFTGTYWQRNKWLKKNCGGG